MENTDRTRTVGAMGVSGLNRSVWNPSVMGQGPGEAIIVGLKIRLQVLPRQPILSCPSQ